MSERFDFSVRNEKVAQVKRIKQAFELAGMNWSNWVVCLMINQFEKEEWEANLERLQKVREWAVE